MIKNAIYNIIINKLDIATTREFIKECNLIDSNDLES